MKPLRLAVAVVVLAVIVGILATPWMQVVEEHIGTEELPYTTTYAISYTSAYTSTHTYAQAKSPPLLEASKVHLLRGGAVDASRWKSNVMRLQEGQTIRIELSMTPPPSEHGKVSFDLLQYQRESNSWLPVVSVDTAPSGDYGPKNFTVPKTGDYIAILFNTDVHDVHVDLRLMFLEITVTELPQTTTSTEFRVATLTSTVTITWYNTTYERPLG